MTLRKVLTSALALGLLAGVGAGVSSNVHARRVRRPRIHRIRRHARLSNYITNNSFRHHEKYGKEVRTIRGAFIYGNKKFGKFDRDMYVPRSTKLGVYRVFRYAKNSNVLRLQLTSGQYFTANKNFVKVIGK